MTVTSKKSKSKWKKKVRRNRELPSNANTSTLLFYFRPEKQPTYLDLSLKSDQKPVKPRHEGKSHFQ